ncbi:MULTISPECIES: hypothetical protein [Micromonospora]|uniref:hypothetical protein n=1 Tax=Micromonospora TaxID=1873 RepID=UPI00081FEB52|nr:MULTISPECIES: hypothetical protein [Micromonospora]MBQ1037592.1 hypothetical protein [Micromonospora sp. C81]TQJ21863.1 hypothetical protein FBZ33_2091 [Micromonospora sp. A202]WTI24113.1 hypothetical protein OG886_13935 [Micromonospora zamorensis]SCG45121.1 hypothetical protein GA0070619_1645 [Micromonospora zamorensis]
MFRRLENLGERMLGVFVPKVTAAAGCPPDPYCALCGTCYFKRCSTNLACKTTCGSCGYYCSAGASTMSALC